jgi:hypothetical protein
MCVGVDESLCACVCAHVLAYTPHCVVIQTQTPWYVRLNAHCLGYFSTSICED